MSTRSRSAIIRLGPRFFSPACGRNSSCFRSIDRFDEQERESRVSDLQRQPPFGDWHGRPTIALQTHLGHDGRSARDPFSQRTAAGRLQPDLRTMGITDAISISALFRSRIPTASAICSLLCLPAACPMVLSRDRMPRAVLDDLARTGATVFPGMPIFYQAFCEMKELPPLPTLASLHFRRAHRCRCEVARKFSEKFGRADPFVLRIFGMRRHLLRSRRHYLRRRFRRHTDARCRS